MTTDRYTPRFHARTAYSTPPTQLILVPVGPSTLLLLHWVLFVNIGNHVLHYTRAILYPLPVPLFALPSHRAFTLYIACITHWTYTHCPTHSYPHPALHIAYHIHVFFVRYYAYTHTHILRADLFYYSYYHSLLLGCSGPSSMAGCMTLYCCSAISFCYVASHQFFCAITTYFYIQ